MNRNTAFLIATFLKTGYAPKAPGTFGSLATIPLAVILAYFLGTVGIALGMIVSYILGSYAVKEVLKETEHDPSIVVIDEVLGQLTTFLFVAHTLQGNMQNAWLYLVGFAFFRFFDICKFGIVKWADEKLLNEKGVMLDDLFAGIFAGIILFLINYFI